jgi:hypothetical protein
MTTGTENYFYFCSNSNIWLWCVFLKYNFTNDQRGIKEIPKFKPIQYTVYTVINAQQQKNDWNNNILFFFFSTESDKNIYPCYSNRTYVYVLRARHHWPKHNISCALFKYSDTVIDKVNVVINHIILLCGHFYLTIRYVQEWPCACHCA